MTARRHKQINRAFISMHDGRRTNTVTEALTARTPFLCISSFLGTVLVTNKGKRQKKLCVLGCEL